GERARPGARAFPTRRSSDLLEGRTLGDPRRVSREGGVLRKSARGGAPVNRRPQNHVGSGELRAEEIWTRLDRLREHIDDHVEAADRKSTRLNSSHVHSAYAV